MTTELHRLRDRVQARRRTLENDRALLLGSRLADSRRAQIAAHAGVIDALNWMLSEIDAALERSKAGAT